MGTSWTVNTFRIFILDWPDSPRSSGPLLEGRGLAPGFQLRGENPGGRPSFSIQRPLFRRSTHIHHCPWHAQPFPELISGYLLEWGRGITQWLERRRGARDLTVPQRPLQMVLFTLALHLRSRSSLLPAPTLCCCMNKGWSSAPLPEGFGCVGAARPGHTGPPAFRLPDRLLLALSCSTCPCALMSLPAPGLGIYGLPEAPFLSQPETLLPVFHDHSIRFAVIHLTNLLSLGKQLIPTFSLSKARLPQCPKS